MTLEQITFYSDLFIDIPENLITRYQESIFSKRVTYALLV